MKNETLKKGKPVNPNNLTTELAKPAYNGMSTADKVAALQARTVDVPGADVYVSREKIRSAFDPSEWELMSASQQRLVLSVLSSDSIAVEGSDASLLAAAFAGRTTTINALVALRDAEKLAARISPAESIGFGGLTDEVLTDWVNKAGA